MVVLGYFASSLWNDCNFFSVRGLEPFGKRRKEFGKAKGRKAERAGASPRRDEGERHLNSYKSQNAGTRCFP